MKQLIPMNEFGLMAGTDCIARVDSRKVAEVFGKQHKHVLRDIEHINQSKSGLTEEFRRTNFEPITYKDQQGRKQPAYLMTREGFVMLVMGYTGKKAMGFKEAFLRRFCEMEQHIQALQELKDKHPMLMDAIKNSRENPNSHDYINEVNMLNCIALGMSAKKYRQVKGLRDDQPIRQCITPQEASLMEYLVTLDIGFQYTVKDYHERKKKLEGLAREWREKAARLPAA